jgi:spermidine synthase
MAVILLVSGFCSLVYQVAWFRLLRLIFGASTPSSAVVVAIFMGGLGLGGWWLGRRADRAANPLDLYARLELGIAVTAALTPVLVFLASRLYSAVGGTETLGGVLGTVVKMALSTLVLGPATFLMGGTLPAAVRAVERREDRGRRMVGVLYGINTLGAVVGTAFTTFIAIELLGIRKTLWLAALANLLLAVTARALARRHGEAPDRSPVAGTTGEPAAETAARAVGLRFALAAAALVGFAFFLQELVWYRMLSPILGGSSYTFGLILAVALSGIGLGGLLYGWGNRERRPTPITFAWTCSLEALAIALPFALGDRIALLALQLRGLGSTGFAGLVLGWTLVTAVVVLPAAIIAGYQFPVLVGLLGAGRREVGREVGQAYAWNTVGAIAGCLAGGFGFLPWLSAPRSWQLVGWLLAGLAVVAAFHGLRGGRGTAAPAGGRGWPVATALAAGLLMLAPGPSAVWRHGSIGAGRLTAQYESPNALRATLDWIRSTLWWEKDGLEAGVALIRDQDVSFYVNGKSDGAARGDAPTQVMLALVAAAIHPQPESVLVIGLGTGSTVGWLAQVPTIERADVVEIEPVIREVAERLSAVNHDALDNPRVHLTLADAREVLLTTRRRYDLIVSEPSNPYRAGISSLFSREFYQASEQRLEPGGLFVQWLQGYEIDAAVVRMAYATLLQVFPVVETWRTHAGDLLLLASREPLPHDPARLERKLATEPFKSALSYTWGVNGLAGFYSGYIGGPELARQVGLQEGQRISTDDRPLIEFGFVRNLGRSGLFSLRDLSALARRNGIDRPPAIAAVLDWSRVDELAEARQIFFSSRPSQPPQRPESDHELPAFYRSHARFEWLEGRFSRVVELWDQQSEEPAVHADRLLLAHSLARVGDPRAPAAIDRLREMEATEALTVEAIWHRTRGDRLAAADTFARAFEAYRRDPWPLIHVMTEALTFASDLIRELARDPDPSSQEAARAVYQAMGQPFAAQANEGKRRQELLRAAEAIDFPELCVEVLEALEPYPTWEVATLRKRVRCYRENNHPLLRQAEHDLLEFLEAEPPPLLDPATAMAEAERAASATPQEAPGGAAPQ